MAARCLRVLLAEKRLSEAGIILRSICAEAGWALELIYVATRKELGEALQAYSPDVALLDLSLLQPEAANYLRGLYLAHSSIPLILFAEADDKSSAVECLSMGARDFLLEGYMDERTVARVLKSAVGSREETEMMATVYADSETGCALSAELERDEETTDQMESGASDGVMHGLLKVLKRNVRARDQVVPGRRGQIKLVLSDTNKNYHEIIVKRIRARVKAYQNAMFAEFPSAVTIRAEPGAVVSRPLSNGEFGCAVEGGTARSRFRLSHEGRR